MSTPEATTNHAVAEALLVRLRESLAALEQADLDFGHYVADDEDDPWTPEDPQPYWPIDDTEEPERTTLLAFEEAWRHTWHIVQELAVLGYPVGFSETDCEPLEVIGLTFVARFEREVTFGPLVFAHWEVDLAGEAQQGSSGFSTHISEDEHGIPDVFFVRLGLERTESDFPSNYDDACEMFGLDDDDDWDDYDDDDAAKADDRSDDAH
jgi:hypothetical protein